QQRNLLATLLLSQGVPMLLAGDEIGRSQRGNNNAYCQDNKVSWIDWELNEEKRKLLAFTQRVIALRRAHPVFRRRDFYKGHPLRGQDIRDIVWLRPEGGEMSDDEWNQHFARCLGVYLAGEALSETDERGRPVRDVNFLVLYNAHHEPVPFKLPDDGGTRWHALLDTAFEDGLAQDGFFDGGARYGLQGRCIALLQQVAA
ncbi:MAG: glycogen debranching protein GlgX, partial [Burkholderiales bacterium]